MEQKIFGNPEEYLHLYMLLRWERTAPPDGCLGTLDDEPAKNTQTARMAKVLQMVTDLHDLPMEKLRKETERKDGRSYIQRILQSLPQLGLSSREFANCAADFVGGKSIQKYWPDEEQAVRQIEQWEAKLDREDRWQLAAAKADFAGRH